VYAFVELPEPLCGGVRTDRARGRDCFPRGAIWALNDPWAVPSAPTLSLAGVKDARDGESRRCGAEVLRVRGLGDEYVRV